MLQGFTESRTDTLRISPGGMTRLGHLLTHLRGFCEPHVFSAVKLVHQAFLTFPWHNCKAIGWKCNTSRRSRPTCTCTARHKISDQTAILNHLSQTSHLLPHKCAFQVSSTLIGGFNPSSKSSKFYYRNILESSFQEGWTMTTIWNEPAWEILSEP